MSTLTDAANGISMARKQRENEISALNEGYEAAHNDLYTASLDAERSLGDFEKAFRLTRKAIEDAYTKKVAELTGVEVEDIQDGCW